MYSLSFNVEWRQFFGSSDTPDSKPVILSSKDYIVNRSVVEPDFFAGAGYNAPAPDCCCVTWGSGVTGLLKLIKCRNFQGCGAGAARSRPF